MDCRVKPGNDDCDFYVCITARSVHSPPPCGEGVGVGVRQPITARPTPRRFAPTLPTRGRVGPSSRLAHSTPYERWRRLYPHLHHHPPAREERRERVCRLNGFHFTAATGSAADWRGEIASGAKSSTATAAATASAAARSCCASASVIKPSCRAFSTSRACASCRRS